MDKHKIKEAARILSFAHFPIALTGAGISEESGIPAFRGEGGLWAKYNPAEYAHINAFLENPKKVWQMLKELDGILRAAKPNPAHKVLALMEAEGLLKGIVTQNVDNLHQAAGSKRVVEFHGNAFCLRCLSCGRAYKKEDMSSEQPLIDLIQDVPRCHCGGLLKPDVVFFGENIPTRALLEAQVLTAACDVMLIIGTSGEVAPANYLPYDAKQHGAKIIEINLEATILTEAVTDIFLQGKASKVLIALEEEIRGMRGKKS